MRWHFALAFFLLSAPAFAGEDSELIRSTFVTLDTDSDGSVSRGELASFPLLASVFATADEDGNQALSGEEFRELIRLARRQRVDPANEN